MSDPTGAPAVPVVVEEPKDAHGCLVGKEIWSEEKQVCVPIKPEPEDESVFAKDIVNRLQVQVVQLALDKQTHEALIVKLTKQLTRQDDLLESQDKRELLMGIVGRTSITPEVLGKSSVAELKVIKATLDSARAPTYKNIREGRLDSAVTDAEKGISIGSLRGIPLGETEKKESA